MLEPTRESRADEQSPLRDPFSLFLLLLSAYALIGICALSRFLASVIVGPESLKSIAGVMVIAVALAVFLAPALALLIVGGKKCEQEEAAVIGEGQ